MEGREAEEGVEGVSSQEGQHHEVRVYRECTRGVRRVAGLKRQQLSAGHELGVAADVAVTLLVSSRHIEFALVLDTRGLLPPSSSSSSSSAGGRWLGFSYFGYVDNLKRCFRKPLDDIRDYFALLHTNLTTKFSDPYASPLLFVGDSYEKAFWQISTPEAPHSVVGFIPFRPVNLFHSLSSHPIIALEGSNYPIFTMVSAIDREKVRAQSPELDARYQQMIDNVTASVRPHKLALIQVRSVTRKRRKRNNADDGGDQQYSDELIRKVVDAYTKHYSSRDPATLRPILVSDFVVASEATRHEIDLASISLAPTGKSHLMQVAQVLSPGTPNNKVLIDSLPKELDRHAKRLETLKNTLDLEPRIAIYNPFLAANTREVAVPTLQTGRQASTPSPTPQTKKQTRTEPAAHDVSLLTSTLQQQQQQTLRSPNSPRRDEALQRPSTSSSVLSTPVASSSKASPIYLSQDVNTTPSAPLHLSQGAVTANNSTFGSQVPYQAEPIVHGSSRPATPASSSRPFLRLSLSHDSINAVPDTRALYRRLVELLYVSHPLSSSKMASFNEPLSHQHLPPQSSLPYLSRYSPAGSSPSSLMSSASNIATAPTRRFCSSASSPGLRLSTNVVPASPSWKRFPHRGQASLPSSGPIDFGPASRGVDYSDVLTPDQLRCATPTSLSSAQPSGNLLSASQSPLSLSSERITTRTPPTSATLTSLPQHHPYAPPSGAPPPFARMARLAEVGKGSADQNRQEAPSVSATESPAPSGGDVSSQEASKFLLRLIGADTTPGSSPDRGAQGMGENPALQESQAAMNLVHIDHRILANSVAQVLVNQRV